MANRLVGKCSTPLRGARYMAKPFTSLRRWTSSRYQVKLAVFEPSAQLVASEVEIGGETKTGGGAWEGLISLVSSSEESQQSREDMLLIFKALKLAADSLEQDQKDTLPCGRLQLQKSLAVASLLIAVRYQNCLVDADTIAASIVAMEVSSGKLKLSTVDSALGSVVASTVAGLSDLQSIVDKAEILDDFSSRNIKDTFMASNLRSVIICIGIVWDDIRRCNLLPLYRQQQIALEANILYAPLAHALGLKDTAYELENISLRTLFPLSYDSTKLWLEENTNMAVSSLASIKEIVENAIRMDMCINQLIEGVEVHDRVKTLDSFMRKLLSLQSAARGGRKKEEIYDAVGLRVVVHPKHDLESAEKMAVKACYLILELLHRLWSPIQDRTKDYIVRPKPNGYQSLHTTLILNKLDEDVLELGCASTDDLIAHNFEGFTSDVHGAIYESASSHFSFNEVDAASADHMTVPKGTGCDNDCNGKQHCRMVANPAEVFEVQIRTAAMDHKCHFGPSAHPFYKSGVSTQFMPDEQLRVKLLESPVESTKLLKE